MRNSSESPAMPGTLSTCDHVRQESQRSPLGQQCWFVLAGPFQGCEDWGYLFAQVPATSTVSLLEVKYWRLQHIHRVCNSRSSTSNQCSKNPPLRAVKECLQPALEILPGTKLLQAVCICDVIVHPVRRGELVVPDPIIASCSRGN